MFTFYIAEGAIAQSQSESQVQPVFGGFYQFLINRIQIIESQKGTYEWLWSTMAYAWWRVLYEIVDEQIV